MLQEQELKTFVEGTTNYFEVAAQQPASIGSPYLVTDGQPAVHDYTGMITITGKREGVVYFTAPRAMLTVLLMKMQESDFSHETMRDLVGEVANTISGNAAAISAATSSSPCRAWWRASARTSRSRGPALLRHPDQLAQPLGQAGRRPQVGASSARFRRSTFTRDSPKTPSVRGSVLRSISLASSCSETPRARATAGIW